MEEMPQPTTLTKVSSQASPYFWVWDVRGTRSVASKAIGTSRFGLEGANDTELLTRINGHEGWRAADGRQVHG